jgi:hypothetical protein
MGAIRTAAAVLVMIMAATAAVADCVTEARLIGTRSAVPLLVAGPAAWSGSVLAVAKSQEGSASAIWLSVYDENFNPLAADRLVAMDAREITSLLWTGTEFGLFYRTDNQRLHLQRFSMLGQSIGTPIAITANRTVYVGDEIDIAWSGALDAYVVARVISQGSAKGVYVTLVNRDGTQRSDRQLPVFAASQSNLSIAVTNTGVIGLFFVNLNGTLAYARVNATGTPEVRAITSLAGDFIEATAQDNKFIVTRSVADGSRTVIRWFVVDTSHQVIRPDAVLLEGIGADAWPLSLLATADEIALAYVDSEDRNDTLDNVYRLRRFTVDGTLISDTRFAAADVSSSRAESTYDFVWTGEAYVGTAVRRSSERLNSYLLRFCPLRVTVTTNVMEGRPGQPVTFTATPEGGVPGYSYAWTFGDATRVFRTQSVSRTYDEVGTYTATLTVTDTSGASTTTTYTINVAIPPEPPKPRRRATRH